MMSKQYPYQNIDEYIHQFPQNIQNQLTNLRNIIQSFVPKETTEIISWGMPTFYFHGNVIHFAANKNHIGLYPGADCIELFSSDLGDLLYSKGAIQFPYGIDFPVNLIKKIVEYRIDSILGQVRLEKK